MKFINWFRNSPVAKALLKGLASISLLAHLVFYTWPITARLVPTVVEVLRLPTAFVLAANTLFLSLPLLLMSLYMRFRWKREGVLAERLTQQKHRRFLRTAVASLLFHTAACALLCRFHTRDVAASVPLQLLIVVIVLTFFLWDIKSQLRRLRKQEKPSRRRF